MIQANAYRGERTCKFCARTVLMFVIPSTKHIESKIFDLPEPFRPVIELKLSSQPLMTVLTAYDLKPSMTTSMTLILAKGYRWTAGSLVLATVMLLPAYINTAERKSTNPDLRVCKSRCGG